MRAPTAVLFLGIVGMSPTFFASSSGLYPCDLLGISILQMAMQMTGNMWNAWC